MRKYILFLYFFSTSIAYIHGQADDHVININPHLNGGRFELTSNTTSHYLLKGLHPKNEYILYLSSSNDCNLFFSDKGKHTARMKFSPEGSQYGFTIHNDCEDSPVYLSVSCLSCASPVPENAGKIASNLEVETADAATLVNDVFIQGGCFEAFNITRISEGNNSIGQFSSGNSSISIDNGIIISTGSIFDAPGPNGVVVASKDYGNAVEDQDLKQLMPGYTINDVAGIEFDFIPTGNTVEFRYAFASEEYCEWVNSPYNDVFGFFISGPGISGGFSNGAENIAVTPTDNLYVGINSINHTHNSTLFHPNADNCGSTTNMTDIRYDGFTTILTASANVTSCETYHIKLVIGDVNDGFFDSAVFLEANSFYTESEITVSTTSLLEDTDDTILEGCLDGAFVFTRQDTDNNEDVVLNLSYGGTATPDEDYEALPASVVIPAGSNEVTLPVHAFYDNLPEGVETIILSLQRPCHCSVDEYILNITDYTEPQASLGDDIAICNGESVDLSTIINDGRAPYSYAWSNGQTAPTITVNPTTTQDYYVTVTDACEHTTMDTVTVLVNDIEATIDPPDVLTCTVTEIDLQANATTTGENLTYSWSVLSDGHIVSGEDTPAITVDAPGIYELTVTDTTTNCSVTTQTTVTQSDDLPNIVINPVNMLTCANTAVTIDASGSSSGSQYDYQWMDELGNDLGSSSTLTVTTPGDYTLTITNNQTGCTSSNTTTIAQDTTIPQIDIPTPDTITCDQPTVTVQNIAAVPVGTTYSYQWTNTNNNNTELSATININQPGNYTLTLTNQATGCTNDTTVTVTENTVTPMAAIATPLVLHCNQPTVTLDGTGSTTGSDIDYEWTDEGGNTIGNAITTDVSNPGNYTLTVSNTTNGCATSTTVTVTEEAPVAVISAPQVLTCTTTSFTLNNVGSSTGLAYSYTWQDSGGNILGHNNTITVNTPDTYSLTVTNNDTGCEDTAYVTVTQDITAPNVLIAPPDTLSCVQTTVTLDGTGGDAGSSFSFEWSNSEGSIVGHQTTLTVNSPGDYTLTVTNTTNGCSTSATVTVIQGLDTPTATIAPPGALNCATTSIVLDGSGSSSGAVYHYEWTDSDGNVLGNNTTQTVSSAGIYTLTITNTSTGCSASDNVTVVNDNPVSAIIAPPPLTCAVASVTLDGTPSSQGAQYSYEWTDENGISIGNNITVDANATGTYTLTVTNNDNGCTDNAQVTVIFDTPVAVIAPADTITCYQPTEILDGTGSSTGINYAYDWTTGGVTIGNQPTVTINSGGTYILTVTNTDNGCSASDTITIAENTTPPIAVVAPPDTLNCAIDSLILDATGSSTGPEFTYEWTNPSGEVISTTLTAIATEEGTYTFTVTNTGNGCTAVETVSQVMEDYEPEIVLTSSGNLSCTVDSVTLDASGSGIPADPHYEWTDAGGNVISTDLTVTVGATGTYTFTLTDNHTACYSAESITVAMENMDATIATPDNLTCDNNTVTLDASASSHGDNFTYEWQNQDGTTLGTALTLEVSTPGTYTFITTNTTDNCSANTAVTVVQDTVSPVIAIAIPDTLTCSHPVITLDASASATGNEFTYLWMKEGGDDIYSTQNIDVSTPGNYTLTITNTNTGCTSSETVTVTENTVQEAVTIPAPDSLTCAITTVTLTANISTSHSGDTYEWTNENGDVLGTAISQDITAAGIYTFTLTNGSNGCTSTATTTVFYKEPIAVIQEPAILTCDTTEITLNAAGSTTGTGYVYQWTDTSANIISDSLTANVTTPGTYSFTVTNIDNSCSTTASVEVLQNITAPVAVAGTDEVLTCAQTVITINSDGSSTGSNFSYKWKDKYDNLLGNQTEVNVLNAGDYTLTVRDNTNGCTATDTITVAEAMDAPTVIIQDPSPLTCNDTTTQLITTGSSTGANFSYSWTNPSNEEFSTDLSPTVHEHGLYLLTITNTDNGCAGSQTTLVVEHSELPDVIIAPHEELTCVLTTVTLDAGNSSSGENFSYTWQNEDGDIVGNNTAITVTDAGVYNLTIENTATGCSASGATEVKYIAPTSVIASSDTLNCENTTVTLDGTGSSTGNNYAYEWTNEAGQVISHNLTTTISTPGNYTLTVTNTDNNCQTSEIVTILQNIDKPVIATSTPDTLTCAVHDVSIEVLGDFSDGDYAFHWTDPLMNFYSEEQQINVPTATTYYLSVENTMNKCVSYDTVVVHQDIAKPILEVALPEMLSCVITEVTLDGSGSETGPKFTYLWNDENDNNIGNGMTTTVTTEGIYQFTVTNEVTGCTSTTPVPVFGKGPFIVLSDPDTLTCTRTEISLETEGSSTGEEYTYLWTDENDLTFSHELSPVFTEGGEYTLTLTDTTDGCATTKTVNIPQDVATPAVVISAPPTMPCNWQSLVLDGMSSSSGPEFTNVWTNEIDQVLSNELNAEITAPGDFTLTITNNHNGCSASSTVTVDPNPEAPDVSIALPDTLTCSHTVVTIDGSQSPDGIDYEHHWLDSLGNEIGSDLVFEVNAPGEFLLTITNLRNGCIASGSVEVFQDIEPPINALETPDTLDCALQTVELIANEGITQSNLAYEWTNTQGEVIGNTGSTTVGNPGQYSLLVTDTHNGCQTKDSLTVFQDIETINPSILPPDTLSCAIDTAFLDASANVNGTDYQYEWTNEADEIFSTDSIAFVTTTGQYVLTITNDRNHCYGTDTIEVVYKAPSAAIALPDTITCAKPVVTISAGESSTGSQFTYEWTDASGQLLGTADTLDVNEFGEYTLSVTDTTDNCVAIAAVTVMGDTIAPAIDILPPDTLNCKQTSITLTGINNSEGNHYVYNWKNHEGDIQDTTLTTDVSDPGDYNFEVTNQLNGCTTTKETYVPQNLDSALVVLPPPDTLTCVRLETGLQSTGSSRGAEFTYNWMDETGTSLGTDTSAVAAQTGIYTLTITNAITGCTASNKVEVMEDLIPPVADAGRDTIIGCAENDKILLDGSQSSTGPDMTYLWETQSGDIITAPETIHPGVTSVGSYFLTVTDEHNGCQAKDTVEVGQNLPVAVIQPQNPLCYGETGSIAIPEVTGGTPSYVYSIDGGQTFSLDSLFADLHKGYYTVVVQDALGCEHEEIINIQEPDSISLWLEPEITVTLGDSYTLKPLLTGTTENHLAHIEWTPVDNLSCFDCFTPVTTPTGDIEYEISVLTDHNCPASAKTRIKVENDYAVFIPNAFTPNDDGENDIFSIKADPATVKRINKLLIFDRWGNLMYKDEDYDPADGTHGWDGYFRGERMNPAVFVYFAQIEFVTGEIKIFEGDLTLFR